MWLFSVLKCLAEWALAISLGGCQCIDGGVGDPKVKPFLIDFLGLVALVGWSGGKKCCLDFTDRFA